MPTTSIRVSGTYREVRNKWVRVSGQWRQVANTWVRVSGQWELVYRRAFTFNASINSVTNNSFNLRSQAIAAGWDQSAPLEATVTINAQLGNSIGAAASFIADGTEGSGFPAESFLNLVISTAGDSIRGAWRARR